MACEMMVPNNAIRNLIREDKLHQIYSQMQIGQSKFGMQTLNQALCSLYLRRVITLEEALGRSSEIDELRTMIATAQSQAGAAGAAATQQGARRPPGRQGG
jgi:twitching motility protein PilT